MARAGKAQASQQCCPGSNPCVDVFLGFIVCCWFRGLPFSPLPKKQNLQIPIRPGMENETAKWMDHIFCFKFYIFYLFTTYMDSGTSKLNCLGEGHL